MRVRTISKLVAAGVVLALGCRFSVAVRAAEGDAYKLTEAPKDAAEVLAARKNAKDQDQVVVVGRIGGRKNPWIKGTAAFSIVDRSKRACNEIPGDTCKTPWD